MSGFVKQSGLLRKIKRGWLEVPVLNSGTLTNYAETEDTEFSTDPIKVYYEKNGNNYIKTSDFTQDPTTGEWVGSMIPGKTYYEYHPSHLKTKAQKLIRKAWVGNEFGVPELVLYSEQYYTKDSNSMPLPDNSTHNYYYLDSGFVKGDVIIFNDEMYMIGGGINRNIYKFNPNSNRYQWTQISYTPFSGSQVVAAVFNNKIYVIDMSNSSLYVSSNGTSWENKGAVRYNGSTISDIDSLFVFDSSLVIRGGSPSYLYQYDEVSNTWYKTSKSGTAAKKLIPYHGYLYGFGAGVSGLKGSGTVRLQSLGGASDWENVNSEYGEFEAFKGMDAAVDYVNSAIYIVTAHDDGHYCYKFTENSGFEQIADLPLDYRNDQITEKCPKYMSLCCLPIWDHGLLESNYLYFFGGDHSGYASYRYDIESGRWHEMQGIPYKCSAYGGSCIHNNKIYIYGGANEIGNNGYSEYESDVLFSYDGSKWKNEGAYGNNYSFAQGCFLEYNGELHRIGGGSQGGARVQGKDYFHEKFVDATGMWTSVDSVPNGTYNGAAVVYHDKIYVFGGTDHGRRILSYDDTNGWQTIGENIINDYNIKFATAVVYHDKIYLIGGMCVDINTGYAYWNRIIEFWNPETHWEDQGWSRILDLSESKSIDFDHPAAVVYNDRIHIFGGYDSTTRKYTKHCSSKGRDYWKMEFDTPYDIRGGSAVVYEDEIYLLGSEDANDGQMILTNYNNYFK